jgi:hypothetical protein
VILAQEDIRTGYQIMDDEYRTDGIERQALHPAAGNSRLSQKPKCNSRLVFWSERLIGKTLE